MAQSPSRHWTKRSMPQQSAEGGDHAFVIGGAQLYALALPHVQRCC
jgi:dihydrofolate reductase